MACPPALVNVVRDGVVESVHRGHVAVTDAGGALRWALGQPELLVYPRSAAKPFQALASLELLVEGGGDLRSESLAVACASHEGTHAQQTEVAYLLALAGLDESALRCPSALPADLTTLLAQGVPTALAHNCSGKHAAFLLAHSAAGGDPGRYLDPASRLQRRVRDHLAAVTGSAPTGPGTDGCGAPAWLLPLRAIAAGFARLAATGAGPLGRIRAAMTARPDLVGGAASADSAFMLADAGVVAKRGAEAVLAAGWDGPQGPLGIAVKIADGSARAAAPTVAAVLGGLGARVPDALAAPPVLGGGRPHGRIEVTAAVRSCPARGR
ncbi:MAG TPA: asparaginase [Egibacteraceae bacterium]|nr:asparaginase [Egibacteraceae bacterium]